jgi:hypothetical protein
MWVKRAMEAGEGRGGECVCGEEVNM